jgi:type IV pilus assembly protein PilC
MPQFAFQATDRLGNTIEGTVEATDLMLAADQIQRMGYKPVQIRPGDGQPAANAAPEPSPSAATPATAAPARPGPVERKPNAGVEIELHQPATAAPARPRPIDLTQPLPEIPAAAADPFSAFGSGDDAAARKEPWERGGPIPQPPPPQQTTVGMAAGGLGATQAMPPMAGATYRSPAPAEAGRGAEGRRDAAYSLGALGPRPIWQRFKEVMVYPLFSGVVLKDLAAFYRQFAALIDAGLPLYQALVALEGNTQNQKLKEIAHAGQERVQAGGRFSEVMERYPWIFQPIQLAMVRAAEQGGLLEQVLRQVGDYVEHEVAIRRLISAETFYPKIVLFVALMLMGRPGILYGQPAIVELVVKGDTYHYLMDTVVFGLLCLLPFVVFVAVFRLFLFNVPGVREGYDTFKMALPGLGKLVMMFSLAKFARTFAALSRAGFPVGSALKIAGDSSGNAVVRNAAYRAVPGAERGMLVSEALRSSGHFPPMALDMLRTGETAGSIDMMMDKVGEFYESEAKVKSHMVAMIFSVVVLLLVGLLVLKVMLEFYGGYGHAISSEGGG